MELFCWRQGPVTLQAEAVFFFLQMHIMHIMQCEAGCKGMVQLIARKE